MSGRRHALSNYLLTRFKRPDHGAWMPSLWTDTECRHEDLSEQFWQATKPYREAFERLGFTECSLQKACKSLITMTRDNGAIIYLDSRRCCLGQLIYTRIRNSRTGSEANNIVVAFTAAFHTGSLTCSNHMKAFDPPSEHEVIRVASYDVAFIYREFLTCLQRRKETPRAFHDLESLRCWYDAHKVRAFEDRARRKLFIPMSEQEIDAAKQRMADAAVGIFPRPRQGFRIWVWSVVIVALIGLQFIRLHHGGVGNRSIEYRGEHFRMRKAYATYEDYKDDPDNLDPNELDRIEKAMTSAMIPSSFKDRETMIHVMFALKFPGYGMGSIGEPAKTDDGSLLEIESVEIPQRNKDRCIVVQSNQGQWRLVDDFVCGTATNVISHVTLEKGTLRYYDDKRRLLREKLL